MITPKKSTRPASILALFRLLRARHRCGWGLAALWGTLLLLSLLAQSLTGLLLGAGRG